MVSIGHSAGTQILIAAEGVDEQSAAAFVSRARALAPRRGPVILDVAQATFDLYGVLALVRLNAALESRLVLVTPLGSQLRTLLAATGKPFAVPLAESVDAAKAALSGRLPEDGAM